MLCASFKTICRMVCSWWISATEIPSQQSLQRMDQMQMSDFEDSIRLRFRRHEMSKQSSQALEWWRLALWKLSWTYRSGHQGHGRIHSAASHSDPCYLTHSQGLGANSVYDENVCKWADSFSLPSFHLVWGYFRSRISRLATKWWMAGQCDIVSWRLHWSWLRTSASIDRHAGVLLHERADVRERGH
jgi:hypothetical protein